MADFDAQAAQAAQDAQDDRDRGTFLEQNVKYLLNQIQQLQNQPPPPSPPRPNLNLPTPPQFFGLPTKLPLLKLKLLHYLVGNQPTYHDSQTQLLFVGSLLVGSAGQWYHALVDPVTLLLPPTYDLPRFFHELEGFFGGAVTLQARERSLDTLRQTRTVSELAIAFHNITHTFSPRWPDHPFIYIFSKKLRENIRFELTALGSLPTTFPTYLAAAIAVEQKPKKKTQKNPARRVGQITHNWVFR